MACIRDHNREASPDAVTAMAHAMDLARATHPHPNPRVGAVVIDAGGSVAGCGAHERAGEPHAEVIALAEAGGRAAGSTLFVTLEPCSHHGHTPPCTDAVIASGVARVVVGAVDPDTRVSGRGIERLRAAGIAVDVVPDPSVVEEVDPGYFHHRRTGRPLTTVKLAATLDGQAAAADGTSQWITGIEARRDAHRLRAGSDAVIVGAGTLRADDPRLDVRLEGFDGPQPRPVVIAGGGELPASARLWSRDALVYTGTHRELPPVDSVVIGGGDRLDLNAVLEDLGSRGVLTVLVEGGPTLASAFVAAGLADRFVLYYGALLGGGMGRPALGGSFATLADGLPVVIEDLTMVGPDVRLVARPARQVA